MELRNFQIIDLVHNYAFHMWIINCERKFLFENFEITI
jgi:hypothetical protein